MHGMIDPNLLLSFRSWEWNVHRYMERWLFHSLIDYSHVPQRGIATEKKRITYLTHASGVCPIGIYEHILS